MVKRVFIVHGWDSSPTSEWFPWMKKQLENLGFKVNVPKMPNPLKPDIGLWIGSLDKIVDYIDEDTYFIGHSVGCQAILRYLASIDDSKVKGKTNLLFVGGWFSLSKKAIETDEDKEVAAPWLEDNINFTKIKKITNKITAIFSKDDYYVPIENSYFFKNNLSPKIKIVLVNGFGHFSEDDGIIELPVALKEFLEILKS